MTDVPTPAKLAGLLVELLKDAAGGQQADGDMFQAVDDAEIAWSNL